MVVVVIVHVIACLLAAAVIKYVCAVIAVVIHYWCY